MRVWFKSYDSKMASREKLFKAATEFASKIGEERLINITHSEDRDNIVITIWYWGDQEEKEDRQQVKKPLGKFASPGKSAGSPLEQSGSAALLEQSGSAGLLEQSASARAKEQADSARPRKPADALVRPTPIEEIILPVMPPKLPRREMNELEDSW